MTQRYELFYSTHLKRLLLDWGFNEKSASLVVDFSALFLVLLGSVILYYILKYMINRFLRKMILRSSSRWDDHLYEQKVFTRLLLLVPAILVELFLSPTIFDYPASIRFIEGFLEVYSAVVIMIVINSFLNAVYHIYGDTDLAESKPIKGYVQIGKIIVYLVGAIIIISMLIGQSPLKILAGLGALSAVLLLIFKDSILGFVAGVQISNNHLLMIGDWITMPKYGVDGVVTDISLVIVKVKNFDNSVSSIPTYAFISDSFQNWRNLAESGGRRLKRHINIDAATIRSMDEKSMDQLSKFSLPEDLRIADPKTLTNLSVFRRYLLQYLRTLPEVNLQMTLSVRLLQPTDLGQPLEIFAYATSPDFTSFENLQSAIFEHIYSVLPEFDLRIRQGVAGKV